ncbi:MAG: hypothetical protein OXT65_06160 [Alphaproteobacteria bacterium]|nr:hypothetical protein [Alphaproteobacteria bacterium]
MSQENVLEKIYTALINDNEGIDDCIAELKATGQKSIAVDPARLVQNNRQGRKTLQAYFKKRGVSVTFTENG